MHSNHTKTTGRLTAAQRASAAVLVGLATLAVVPAAGHGATKFGAKLNASVQPSNASSPHECEPMPGISCTRVSMEAYGRPGNGHRAPKSGTIRKIRLIAGAPGKFRLQIAEAKANKEKAKVVANGPKIKHGSSITQNPVKYDVQSFKVNVPVEKGQYLAIKSKETSVLRCSSGGPNQLLFQPALGLGGPFRTADATDGCWLLLEAVIK